MKLREAKDLIERNHPELTGDDKTRAIKAVMLADRARQAPAHTKPKQETEEIGNKVLRPLICWLALMQAAGFVLAVVDLFHPVGIFGRGWLGDLVGWPTLISPAWLGLLASAAAVAVLAMTYVGLEKTPADASAS